MMHDIPGHLPYTTLADLAEGRRAVDAQIQTHLASCTECAAELAWIERVIRLMRDSQEFPPSLEAVARAKRLFLRRVGAVAERPPQLILAALRFDSARGVPAFGVRGEASVDRQLLYRAGPYDLDLHIGPSGKLWVVSGQVFAAANTEHESPATRSATVELHSLEGSSQATLSDESEFMLRPVKAGVYTLNLQLGSLTVVISGLKIGV